MYAQVEKPKENKSKAVADSVAQQKSGVKKGFGFVDNRPEAVVQRKLQDIANNHSAQHQNPIQNKENNTGLPDNVKSEIENLSGCSMDDVIGPKVTQLKTKHSVPSTSSQNSHVNPTSKILQPKGVVQMRTTFAQQMQARTDAHYIVNNTTPAQIGPLQNRMTFNAAPGGDAAIVAALGGYRANAVQIILDFGNVLDIAHRNGFTNYFSDGLDGEIGTLAANAANLRNLRVRNNTAMVDARKLAMFNAVATAAVRQQAYDNNGLAFRNSVNLVAATNALQAWETHYFSLSRAQIIQAAKRRADNGAPGNATVWNGLSAAISGHNTHMTIYNVDIRLFADYLVTAATNRANSDALADHVLANGTRQVGIHLTAEINPPGNANPRVFGNPPNAGRHSVYALPPGMAWADFVAPLGAAQDAVKDDVWILVGGKVAHRP